MLSKISPPPIYPPNFSQNVLLLTSGKTSVQLKQIATKKINPNINPKFERRVRQGNPNNPHASKEP